jgi:hypothetical protein
VTFRGHHRASNQTYLECDEESNQTRNQTYLECDEESNQTRNQTYLECDEESNQTRNQTYLECDEVRHELHPGHLEEIKWRALPRDSDGRVKGAEVRLLRRREDPGCGAAREGDPHHRKVHELQRLVHVVL